LEDNECIHVTFCAYIIILVVSDELNEMDETFIKIKNDVKFVRSSHARLMSFKKCIEKLKVQSKIWVFLDVLTRWDSIYLMLDTTAN
jgi:hypothetical protein